MFSWRVPSSGFEHSEFFEWLEAARWRGYRWEEFEALPGERQSMVVAHFRVVRQMEALQAKYPLKTGK